MQYLSLTEVLDLHSRVIDLAGLAAALRDLGALPSAVAQPRTTIEGADLYLALEKRVAAPLVTTAW